LILLLSRLYRLFLITQFLVSDLDHVPLGLIDFLAMNLPQLFNFLLEVFLYFHKLISMRLSLPELCFLLPAQGVLVLSLQGSKLLDLVIESHLFIYLAL
jgi:hypothetical protein